MLFRSLLDEEQPMPQLIVIDGGKGQLNAALSSIEELGLRGKIAIIGIAKKLEEIYYPEDPVPLYIDKNSETLKVIQQLRNEAHRFGISFHRNRRSKEFIRSELDQISGIGEKTAKILIKEFKSIQHIKNAGLDQLQKAIGKSKGKIVHTYFQTKKTEE